jgi:hypothetical protein
MEHKLLIKLAKPVALFGFASHDHYSSYTKETCPWPPQYTPLDRTARDRFHGHATEFAGPCVPEHAFRGTSADGWGDMLYATIVGLPENSPTIPAGVWEVRGCFEDVPFGELNPRRVIQMPYHQKADELAERRLKEKGWGHIQLADRPSEAGWTTWWEAATYYGVLSMEDWAQYRAWQEPS